MHWLRCKVKLKRKMLTDMPRVLPDIARAGVQLYVWKYPHVGTYYIYNNIICRYNLVPTLYYLCY